MNYIAPEALDLSSTPSISMGIASDVWSLGIILYEMVYHTTPFAAISDVLQKVKRILSPEPIELPDAGNEYLHDVLRSCLQREPKSRPTVQQLLNHKFLM